MTQTAAHGGIDPVTPWDAAETPDPRSGVFREFIPSRAAVLLQQNIGAPCRPVVKAGDRVCIGTVIGDTEEFIAAPVHASISGVVREIAEVPTLSGKPAPAVIIENDFQAERAEPLPPVSADSPQDIIAAVRRAGIVGMGGAAFPSHAKLTVKDKKIDYCLINGAECEPLLQADNLLMLSFPEKIIRGCRLIMRAAGAPQAVIAIEEDKAEAITVISRLTEKIPEITLGVLPHRYPMGGERQLISRITGRTFPRAALPAECGVVVFNTATAAAIADAVDSGLPLTRRLCTVTGDVKEPQTVLFPIGSLAGDVLEFCGGPSAAPCRILFGGAMMGRAGSPDTPLTKSTNGLLAVAPEHDVHGREEDPCIRCNRCQEACPMQLMPQFLDRMYRQRNWRGCTRLHAASCINCGCCTYVCPSGIPLARNITAAVKKMKESQKA